MFKKALLFILGIAILAGSAIAMDLNGAGATFPYPIYSKWFAVYKDQTGVQVNYAPIGSGGGIRQFTAGVVDFGGTDAYMTESEIAAARNDVIHIPTVAGAVAVVTNCGVSGLKLDGDTLADIFLGKIRKWNDPKIGALNPGINLPEKGIVVVHRSDSSGTSDIFTNYLAKVSSKWATQVGAGKSVAWPAGVGGKGNPGVAGAVKNNEGSIGYVEEAYAETNQLDMVAIKNKAGKYVLPSIAGVTAAMAAGINKIPSDFRGSIINQAGAASYPICGLTWLVVHQKQGNTEKSAALKAMLNWALNDGQKYAPELGYAPLPSNLKVKILKAVNSIE